MTVYVDDMAASYGRMFMCHMIADTVEELHRMADAIGVDRRHYQHAGTHRAHYDICLSKRRWACFHGAKEITWRQCGAMVARRVVTGKLGSPEDAETWLRVYRVVRRYAAAIGRET